MPLPNTEVQMCEHPEHSESSEARATALIRFAQDGEVKEFHSCLAHGTAVQFGYKPAATDAETMQKIAGATKPEKDSVLKTGARVRYRARGLSPTQDDRLGTIVGYGTHGTVRIKADHDGELYDVARDHFVYVDETASEDRPSEAIDDGADAEQGAELNEPLPEFEYGNEEAGDAMNAEEEARQPVDGLECRPISEDDDFVDHVDCAPNVADEPDEAAASRELDGAREEIADERDPGADQEGF